MKYKVKDLIEYKSSNPRLPNRCAFINEIKKQKDDSFKIQLISEFNDNGDLLEREYFFNKPEYYATWWVHEKKIIKLINR